MPLWTLLGLAEGRATTKWPRADGNDGQNGVLGMPRFRPERCADDCVACHSAYKFGPLRVGIGVQF